MNKIKRILILQALMLGALTLNADDDCCPDGSEPTYECEDGTMVCDASECPPCSTDNPDPVAPNTACCGGVGGTGYDDGVDACCPNGNQIVEGITNGTISEWCDDCTYVKTFNESEHCCDSEEGTVAYITTLACACFDCIMNDCIGFDWEHFALQNCFAEPLNFCLALLDADIQIVSGNVACMESVCPDTECPSPAAQNPEDPMT